jgi:hypothetical protein
MTHAASSMVRALRGQQNSIGLLYGQGGYLTKHHAIVLGSQASNTSQLSHAYSVQDIADSRRSSVPELNLTFKGQAAIETFTVLYKRDASISHGVVILRSADGTRQLAKVNSADIFSMQALTNLHKSPIGLSGRVSIGSDEVPIWELNQ